MNKYISIKIYIVSSNKLASTFVKGHFATLQPIAAHFQILNSFMVGSRPLDPPPCPNLQMVLTLRNDFEDTTNRCGVMGEEGNTSSDPIVLGNGGSTSSLVEGG